jgi:ComF family protein
VAQAITRMKYEGRPDLARGLGDLLFRAIAPHAGELRGALVVPVPLHPSRLAERGFNQSALVARRVARGLRAPLLPLALARVRDTPRQATLGREARLGNVAGSFVLRQASRVRGRDVVLVDDVHTTGATLGTCAQTLLEGGAARVTTAVVARA